jgi:hypothetical protein
MTAASVDVIPKMDGAKRIYARISKLAGRNDIRMAGRPTFFKSERFRDRPAFNRMIMRANFLKSAEIDKTDGSRKSKTYGPRRTPVSSIPTMRGSFNPSKRDAAVKPTRKISIREVNIKNTPSVAKKLMISATIKSQKSSA